MVIKKNAEQIQNIKVAGNIIAQIFVILKEYLKEGMTTCDIDRYIHELIVKEGGKPAFLGYQGFPASSCISINEEIIHGIPSDTKKIKTGDVVSIDIGVMYQDCIADSAYTYYIGTNPSHEIQTLLIQTLHALQKGIEAVSPSNKISEIAKAVQSVATEHNLGVVKDYCGHGVGVELHEPPEIPNYYPNRCFNQKLKPGMIVAIEPMFTLGSGEITHLEDQTTVVSVDGSYAAHFEHTVLVREEGYQILTI